jgi:tRNA-Thr(GGU) m(6)t(6)A37 methyltransferase TsaA
MNQIKYAPIGTIHSPFNEPEGMPIQPSAGQGIRGHILIKDEFVEGLDDLEGFSHIYLLYHLHLADSYRLKVIPFLDDKLRGVFSTRAPRRPNPIGMSVVKLIHIEGNRLDIENLDIVDGTPLLDIKPYVPEMEEASHIKIGWLSGHVKEINSRKSDRRFT